MINYSYYFKGMGIVKTKEPIFAGSAVFSALIAICSAIITAIAVMR